MRPYLHQIDPVAVHLGNFGIHWYGLAYLAAAGSAYLLGTRRAHDPWRGFAAKEIDDLIFYGMLGVILGGRIGYALFYGFADFLASPLSILKVWQGGMSFHGGMLGVIISTCLWAWKNQKAPFVVLDFVAPIVAIGLGLGRLGNFIGGELWGRRTDAALGVLFPRAPELASYTPEQLQVAYQSGLLDQLARHPSQLYQAVSEGLLLFAAVWCYSRKPRPTAAVGGLFALLYGVQRFLIEFVREPDQHLGFVALQWLTMGQMLCVPMILFGAGLMTWAYLHATPTKN